jgi:hypothetical protein
LLEFELVEVVSAAVLSAVVVPAVEVVDAVVLEVVVVWDASWFRAETSEFTAL